MIDTDKYEGHSQGRWNRSRQLGFKSESVFDRSGRQIASVKLAGYDTKRVNETHANLLLIADAPLLLEEVKRLREKIKTERNLKLWEKAEVKQLRKELDAAEDVILYALDRVGNDDDAKKVFEDFLEVIK